MNALLKSLPIVMMMGTTYAQTIPEAYVEVASQTGLPAQVLYAIAKTESSRSGVPHPWPWTANFKGKAAYFASREALFDALKAKLDTGDDYFDIGIMQVNWHYNAVLFDGDLWSATDPVVNLTVGAKHLKSLYKKTGSLESAISLYHTGNLKTPARIKRAWRYRYNVYKHLQQLSK